MTNKPTEIRESFNPIRQLAIELRKVIKEYKENNKVETPGNLSFASDNNK